MTNYFFYDVSYSDYLNRIINNKKRINPDKVLNIINVKLGRFGNINVSEFDEIENGLIFDINNCNNFKFVEVLNENKTSIKLITEINTVDKKVYFSNQLLEINKDINLFINSWDHVYLQGEEKRRYDFSRHDFKYEYLGVLIYTLFNLDSEDVNYEYEQNLKQYNL